VCQRHRLGNGDPWRRSQETPDAVSRPEGPEDGDCGPERGETGEDREEGSHGRE